MGARSSSVLEPAPESAPSSSSEAETDLIIIYNSGKFRMAGHGSTAGLMSYGDANKVAMEMGEFEVLPVVEEIPVICGVHGSDPLRRMWHFLLQVKDMGFLGR